MAMEDADPPPHQLECRDPSVEDLIAICRELNRHHARYVVVGGFAIRALGLSRHTVDVDLIIATDLENEERVCRALDFLPDKAIRELQPGEVERYTVVRVADELLVDLMKSAGGIDYAEAAKNANIRELDGVLIPFASPQMLWRMKAVTHREKDAPDLLFLKQWFASRGEEPPPIGG